ncbi:jacalin-like lectin [Zooshikella sp. RANM57]|uniref:jacalin-like lectin n=1 Tax=Zooshikella sp. RANM57 TaxID=3425863 RepID=UPI003D6FA265
MRTLLSVMAMSVSLAASAAQFEAGISGGGGGQPFFDNVPSDFMALHSITVCSGSVIDSIEVKYADRSGNIHSYGKRGGNGGSCSTLDFTAGEYITSVSGKFGSTVDSMIIRTNRGNVLAKGGSGGYSDYKYTANAQFSIVGFKGKSARLVDAIGVVYRQTY